MPSAGHRPVSETIARISLAMLWYECLDNAPSVPCIFLTLRYDTIEPRTLVHLPALPPEHIPHS